ncbi:MAG: tetratricopeptide repeat protein [Planctomycetota bacterium]
MAPVNALRPLALLLFAALAACAAEPEAPPSSTALSELSSLGTGSAPQSNGSATARTARSAAASPDSTPSGAPQITVRSELGVGLGEQDLSLWKDPAFQQRFTESYLAESDIEPRVTVIERDILQEVLELIATDQPAAAAERLGTQRTPASSAVFDFLLANLHFQAERLDEAAADYQLAVHKHPKFRRAWRNLGLVQVRRGEFAAAAESLARVIELGGGDAITFGLLGFAHMNEENHLAAESAYRMASLLDPRTVDWKMGMARCFFKQERFADAAALCGQLLGVHPERTDLWLLQANAFLGLDQPLRAVENYEFVDRLGRSTAESLGMLGDLYINLEAPEQAVDAHLRALAQTPPATPERSLRAAKALTARGALAETRTLLQGLEAVHGARLALADRKDLLKLRARLAVAEGAGAEEVRVLEEIVALDPLDGDALLLLGQHSGRSGEAERAIFYYERAASLEAFEADAKVRHAQVLVGLGRYAESLPLLRRAQVLNPRENIQQYLEQVERVAQAR